MIIVGATDVTRAKVQARGPTGRPSSSSPQPRPLMAGSGSGLRTSSTIRGSTVQAQKMAERSSQTQPRVSKMTQDMGDSSRQRSPIYTAPDIPRTQEHRRGCGSLSTTGTDREVYIFSLSACMGLYLPI